MKNKCKLVLAVMLLALGSGRAGAEEGFGINVYNGAKLEEVLSATVSEWTSAKVSCYRTQSLTATEITEGKILGNMP